VECFQFLISPTPWTLSLTPCRLLNDIHDIDDVDSSKGSAFCQELLWLASTHERLCVPWPLSEHGNGCWKLLKIVEICWVHTGPQVAKKVQSLEIPEIWIWNHSEIIWIRKIWMFSVWFGMFRWSFQGKSLDAADFRLAMHESLGGLKGERGLVAVRTSQKSRTSHKSRASSVVPEKVGQAD
jgi:hypothetical protein